MPLELSTMITGVFAGKVADLWPGKPPSAILKNRASGRQIITRTGLDRDAQADLSAHGGTEKALHHYPADHYPQWRQDLAVTDPDHPRFVPGGFGENLSSVGVTEEMVCIGDIFHWGTATLQISQGRQPCWKLAAHTAVPQMAYLVQKTLRTGWYYRMIEPGEAGEGDRLVLTERPHPGYSVARVTRARLDPMLDPAEALDLSRLSALFPGWKETFAERAGADR
jgi:MOSC domain-containing protein YiiM